MGNITCINKKCKRKITKALEILDGALLVCPKCMTPLRLEKFHVSVYNNDLFERAEMYYGRYLSEATKPIPETAGKRYINNKNKEKQQLLESAIEHCTEASLSGHPEARVMLGKLWQAGYMDESKTKSYKMAFHYFKGVCEARECLIDKGCGSIGKYMPDRDSDKVDNPSLSAIKTEAAKCLLRLLVMAKNKLRGSAYDFDGNAKDVKELISSSDVQAIRGSRISGGEGTNYQRNVEEAYKAADSEKKCPLFAYFIIPSRDFRVLWNVTLKALKDDGELHRVISCYSPLTEETNSLTLTKLNVITDCGGDAPDLGNSEYALLYFYNPDPPPRAYSKYFGKGTLEKLGAKLNPRKAFENTVTENLNLLLGADPLADHVFRAEDLQFVLKHDVPNDNDYQVLNALKYITQT